MFGVHVCSKPKPPEEKSSLVVCRGQMALPPEVTLNLLQVQFIHAYNNTASLARQMKASGASLGAVLWFAVDFDEGAGCLV